MDLEKPIWLDDEVETIREQEADLARISQDMHAILATYDGPPKQYSLNLQKVCYGHILQAIIADIPVEAAAAEIGVDYTILQKAIQGKEVANPESMSRIASWMRYKMCIIMQEEAAKRTPTPPPKD